MVQIIYDFTKTAEQHKQELCKSIEVLIDTGRLRWQDVYDFINLSYGNEVKPHPYNAYIVYESESLPKTK